MAGIGQGALVLGDVKLHRGSDLAEVAEALDCAGFVGGPFHSGHGKRCEEASDGDNNKKLYESEGSRGDGVLYHGSWANPHPPHRGEGGALAWNLVVAPLD